jgi:hypothetical protein
MARSGADLRFERNMDIVKDKSIGAAAEFGLACSTKQHSGQIPPRREEVL